MAWLVKSSVCRAYKTVSAIYTAITAKGTLCHGLELPPLTQAVWSISASYGISLSVASGNVEVQPYHNSSSTFFTTFWVNVSNAEGGEAKNIESCSNLQGYAGVVCNSHWLHCQDRRWGQGTNSGLLHSMLLDLPQGPLLFIIDHTVTVKAPTPTTFSLCSPCS